MFKLVYGASNVYEEICERMFEIQFQVCVMKSDVL